MRFPLQLQAQLCADDERSLQFDLRFRTPIPVDGHPGAFGSSRKHDVHTGVDLYALDGEPVWAMSTGTVVAVIPFTGQHANCPWWLDTDAIAVEDQTGIWLYGEIGVASWAKIGATVLEGEVIGYVKRVLRTDKGRPTSMLHLERYIHGCRAFAPIWNLGAPQPTELIDPTPFLEHFDDR